MNAAMKKHDITVAFAGNPNVGKSTLFNSLTGMHQHTGNWPGKTVASARGTFSSARYKYECVDLPGTYSLMAHSEEEEIARDYICFGDADITVVVCDASCLERSLNLALQIIEMTPGVILCVNLIDEAEKRGIFVDAEKLRNLLGVPVVTTAARKKKTLRCLVSALDRAAYADTSSLPRSTVYPETVERAISAVETAVRRKLKVDNARWISVKLLEGDTPLLKRICSEYGADLLSDVDVCKAKEAALSELEESGIGGEQIKDLIVSSIVKRAESVAAQTVGKYDYSGSREEKIDRLTTGRLTAFPIMLALLALVFWLTVVGANYPSSVLSSLFAKAGGALNELLIGAGAPEYLRGALVDGVFRVLGWVISVMLPPMAIFFPLFTILEDVGFLPRIAYNLDKPFNRCKACGKQALTMCMGFGCNAVGVTGCRIIDSPRERLIAVLTNAFVPCNGRFPMLITFIGMIAIIGSKAANGVFSALMLTLVIVTGVALTLASSRLLSETVLKGVPSSFTLELPPYRRPQIGKILVRSVFDRTLFVLGRAAAVAAPAGLVIWLMANVTVSGTSLISVCSDFLDPFAGLLGMDGVILLAFILGTPANEIVVPIMIMCYTSGGSITEASGSALGNVFAANGWTWTTAVSVIIFALCHWPCATTLWTVKKETGSLKWTALSAILPTAVGVTLCFLFNLAVRWLS